MKACVLICLLLAARNADVSGSNRSLTVAARKRRCTEPRALASGSGAGALLPMKASILICLLPLAALSTDLQSALDRAMAGKPGTAVVADVSTGRLLASYRLEIANTRAASPGSALKPFTLLAWMEAHPGARPREWACPRQLRLAGRRLDCTHPLLATPLDAAGALA